MVCTENADVFRSLPGLCGSNHLFDLNHFSTSTVPHGGMRGTFKLFLKKRKFSYTYYTVYLSISKHITAGWVRGTGLAWPHSQLTGLRR